MCTLPGRRRRRAADAPRLRLLPGAFRLIQGGVDHIQHYAVVPFFIAIPASNSADEQRVLAWLHQQQAQVEKVGYVASDD